MTVKQHNSSDSAQVLATRCPLPLARLSSLGQCEHFHRGQEIYAQGQPASRWFRLIFGVAHCSMVQPDGRRQIVDLLFPGDFFGFTSSDKYDSTAEAVMEETAVACYPRYHIEAMADADPLVGQEIRKLAFQTMSRLQTHLLILGRPTATEKVGSFLIALANRITDNKADGVALPISRYDIADCLGISAETVSRALTHLRARGLITLASPRRVRIIDRPALENCPADQRRTHEMAAPALKRFRREDWRPARVN